MTLVYVVTEYISFSITVFATERAAKKYLSQQGYRKREGTYYPIGWNQDKDDNNENADISCYTVRL